MAQTDQRTEVKHAAPALAGQRRPYLLLLAALLLAATAIFHLTGLPMVSGWFEGQRRAVMILLWIAPAASWLLISAFWLFIGARRSSPDWPVLVLTAAIPLVVAVPLLLITPVHPGGYMLLGASILALFSRKSGA